MQTGTAGPSDSLRSNSPFSDSITLCLISCLYSSSRLWPHSTLYCLFIFSLSLLHLQLGCRFYGSRDFVLFPVLRPVSAHRRPLSGYLCCQSCLTDFNNQAEGHSGSSSFMPTVKLLPKVRRIYCLSFLPFGLFSLCSRGAFCTHCYFCWKLFSLASCPPAALTDSETPPHPSNSSANTKDHFLGAISD